MKLRGPFLSATIVSSLFLFAGALTGLSHAETSRAITASYSIQGPIVVQSTKAPVPLRGLEFHAEFGSIIGGNDPGPFETVTLNTNSRWAVSSPVDVILDGELRLDARIVPPTPLQGVTLTGTMTDTDQAYEIDTKFRGTLEAEVGYPHDGGPIVVRSNSHFDKIEITTQSGQLQGEPNSAPFDTVITNSATNWAATSDASVEFSWFESVRWNPWREEMEPTELGVVISPETQATATLSNGYDSITVEITQDAPQPGGLIGGYSMYGGSVFLSTTDGPESISDLTIRAYPNKGQLVGTDNALPFDRVVTNDPTEWSVASSAEVVLDGVLKLDLEVERNTFLTGITHGDSKTTQVVFNGFTDQILEDGFVFAAYPEEGGNIMLLAAVDEPSISGVDFVSSESHAEDFANDKVLTRGTDPAPFGFFLTQPDVHNQVAIGSLGGRVVVDDVVELDVFVSAGDSDHFYFGSGTGGSAIALPVVAIPTIEPPATCVVPQPEIVGDLDGTGTVEFADFLTMSANYGDAVDTYGEGDTNCNGVVDFDDFLRLGNNFGSSTPRAISNVPEPNWGSWGWIVIVLVSCCGQRSLRCYASCS